MFWTIFLLISAVKLLFIPLYHSTDFEVHRNWLAITSSLPISKWYVDKTSEWTLDYPPYFAYFEWLLAQIAKYVDPNMLIVNNLNYDSNKTILFQRLSVILTDIIYAIGVKSCINAFTNQFNPTELSKKTLLNQQQTKHIVSGLALANLGLFFVDHIHFQYNGFMFGILLLSIGKIASGKDLQAAALFAALLNFKHIFIYIAPVYVIYLFKFYCLVPKQNKIGRLFMLAGIVGVITGLSFGPFIHQMPQVLSRLFPFKRGLCHAYWAPNFWTLYNVADKIGTIWLNSINTTLNITTRNTGGLVQEFNHQFLPTIQPIHTFCLTGITMLPCLIKLYRIKHPRHLYGCTSCCISMLNGPSTKFVQAIILCASTAFMFGWHVHEKAILMVLVPLSLLAGYNEKEAKSTIFLSFLANYSLIPLLFPTNLLFIKFSMFICYHLCIYFGLKQIHPKLKLLIFEWLYLFGFLFIFLFEHFIQYQLNLNIKLPFLPLLLISFYCSIGFLYFWLKYYLTFLFENSTIDKLSKKNE